MEKDRESEKKMKTQTQPEDNITTETLKFSRRHKDLIWESASYEEYSLKYEAAALDEPKLSNQENATFEIVRKLCEPERNGVIYCPYVPVERMSKPFDFSTQLNQNRKHQIC